MELELIHLDANLGHDIGGLLLIWHVTNCVCLAIYSAFDLNRRVVG